MLSFLDPVPDPDRVRQVAATLRALHQDLSDQVERVRREHEATLAAWAGLASEAYAASTDAAQQVAQLYADWLVVLADTFDVLGTLLQVISTLIHVWELLQAATVAWTVVSFFTAGVGLAVAGDTEGGIY